MTSTGPEPRQSPPLPQDVESLAAKLDAHQLTLVDAVRTLRAAVDPTAVKATAQQDVQAMRGQAVATAHSAVATDEGDVRAGRMLLLGLTAAGLVALLVMVKARQTRKKSPAYRRELADRLRMHLAELTDGD